MINNKPFSALVFSIISFYYFLQKPLSLICLFIALFANVLGLESLQNVALTSIGFILMQILFDIHEKLSDSNRRIQTYENFSAAVPDMEKLIKQELRKNQSISIQWLGTTMDYGWPFLKEILRSRQAEGKLIDIDIAMISYDWQDIENVNEQWSEEAETAVQSINTFKKYIQNTNVKINLYRYRYMPYWTGLLINKKYLFLAFCKWNSTQYSVGSNGYTLYVREDSFEGKINIQQFEKWFNFAIAQMRV